MSRRGDKSAFPRAGFDGPDHAGEHEVGMSTRTWLVGCALAGGMVAPPWKHPNPDGGPSPDVAMARDLCRIADAVLAELERDDDPSNN